MVKFSPNPLCNYKHKYDEIFRDIALGKLDPIPTYRHLILNDLFFVLFFIVRPFVPGKENTVNHPFVVQACRDVEEGQEDFTLDVWARFHYKSSIITVAETIQYTLKNPEHCTAIFSYANKPAKRFLFTIRDIFWREKLLFQCFPDIVWEDAEKESPLWSIDDGIILKRRSSRKEPTVSAYGLIEGMPTGSHFERRVYDDIVTEDIAGSYDVMERVKDKMDSSQNLTTDGGTHRVIGTYYHHADPLIYIRDKKNIDTGEPMYFLRLKPASDDGTAQGKPVLLSEKQWTNLKSDRSFNCQQLLDPTPKGTQRLNAAMLREVTPDNIPKTVYNFIVVDPAGDSKDGKGDAWAIWLVGVEPKIDEIGTSNIYLKDGIVSTLRDSEAIDYIARLYVNSGVVSKLGIEKMGLSSVEVHVANALRAMGRHLSVEAGNLVILRPAGRSKAERIEQALGWALNNGKIHISTTVPNSAKQRLIEEMDKFPLWHDDALDALSYLYDILKDFRFAKRDNFTRKLKLVEVAA